MKYDLIIIGSGSVGAAAGYYATRAGLNVLMTDAHMPPHQHGSHHGDTRLIRHAYGEGEKYVPLVLRAQMLWDELSRHNEDDPIFVRSGVINLGPADSAFLANVAHSAEQWQLNVEKLDAQGIMARWPELRCCEAKEAGSFLGSIACTHAGQGKKLAFIAGGETVVHLTGKGLGGRNQELALAAAPALAGQNAAVFSVGSDGTDGPTDAAGGYADGDTAAALAVADWKVFDTLQNNDAYHALQAVNGLIITGATGTNVNDVAVVLIGGEEQADA